MAEHPTTPEPTIPLTPAPRKRRWVRRLGVFSLVLLVLAAVGIWAAPGVIARSGYRDRLIADAFQDLNGRVEVRAVSLAWFHPIVFHNVTVFDPDGRPALTADQVSTSRTLFDFVRDRSDLGTITIDRPRLEAVLKDGTSNVEQAIANYLTDDGTPPKPHRTPIRVEATNGTIVLIDPQRNDTRQLDAVSVTVGVPRDRTERVTVDVSTESPQTGQLAVACSFGGGGAVKLTTNGFDTAAVNTIIRRYEPSTVVAGTLTSDVHFGWGDALTVRGRATASDLMVGGDWLGADVIRLQSIDLPAEFRVNDGKLTVDHSHLTCDAGTASFAGTVDTTALDTVFDQTGLNLDADVDAAKVATLLPNLLRVRPGTELTAGRVKVKLASAAGPVGPTWTGSVRTTKLEGRRDGKPLTWDEPLSVTFQGRVRPDGMPAFDDLTVQSDFIGGRARGEPERFDAAVNLELDRLSAHLNDFLDLGGLTLRGSVRNLIVQTRPNPEGGYTLTAGGTVSNLAVLDRDGVGLREPHLTLDAKADGDLVKRAGGTGVRVDTGSLTVTAESDTLHVTLLEPIADAESLSSGQARVNLTGSLARWRTRLGPLVGFPDHWELGGEAKQASAVVSLGEVVSAKGVKLVLTDAAFRGAGLDVNEPSLRLETSDADGGAITFDRKSGAVTFVFATLSSETLGGSVNRLVFRPDATGEYGASGRANVVVRVDRLQKMLRLQIDPALADQFRGTAEGWVDLQAPTFDKLGLNGDLTVKGFEFGPPKGPAWTEPWVRVRLDGEYAVPADVLTLRFAEVSRDGLAASGKGQVGRLSTSVNLDLTGEVTYDLARLEPQLKEYLGKTASAAGKDTKPFRIAGNLLDGGKNLNVAVGGQPADRTAFARLSGNAAVGWQSLRAYGFDVGQSQVTATAENGVVRMTPVEATFGGGKVRVEPTLRLNPGAYDLTFRPGTIVDQAKLTPAACAEAIGYALPAFAHSAQADGTISFELAENRIPLADPTRGTLKGNLTVHDASVAPGPVVTQVIEAFGLATPKLQVKQNSVVPIRLENGRVHHADFVFTVGNTAVTTAGSVGVDGSLDLTVSVPIGSTLAEKLVPGNRPLIHKALARQTITVAIGGTLTKPALNREAMRGQLAKIVQGATQDALKEAGGGLADDLFKKGLEGLFKKK